MEKKITLESVYHKLDKEPGYYALIEADGNIIETDFSNWKLALVKQGYQVHLIPGFFNPLHDSHREIFTNAQRYLPTAGADRNSLVCFEMSIGRIDKPPVTLEQLTERLTQFRGYAPVVISNASRFVAKIGTYINNAEKSYFMLE